MYMIQNFTLLTVNADLTRINVPSETKPKMSYAGQGWQHVIILLWGFLGIKYKQGAIIYLFASYVVSSCSPLAVAPHSLGTQLKLTLVSSETKWFRLRTLRSSWRNCISELCCGLHSWHHWPPHAEQSLLPISVKKKQRTRLVVPTAPWQVKDSDTLPAFLSNSLPLKSHTPKMTPGKMNV